MGKSDNKMSKAIGIFGGSFDPVHNGHLRAAYEVGQYFKLDHIRLIPCGNPPHRGQAVASAQQRLMLLHLAVKSSQSFVVDDREIQREQPSYTFDTLTSLRQEFASEPLFLLIGSDAFSAIDTWHNWQQLLDLAHIVVMARPDETLVLPEAVEDWYQSHQGREGDEQLSTGKIWSLSTTQLAISSTAIRDDLAKGISPAYLMPDAALQLIEQMGLYRDQSA